MEGPQQPDVPKAPTPYRDGKALTEIIPPDRRREKTIAIVVLSMMAGVGLWLGGGWLVETLSRHDEPNPMPATPGYIAGRIPSSVLHGPSGDVRMPPIGRSVVHVWLQGCADCMPAFEAMRDLESNGGLGVRVQTVNVAYGEADPIWARRYGVSENLVFDPGGANVVRPLGIGTFTTLVVDDDGVILHRDRPDKPGYRERVRDALGPAFVNPDHDPLAPPDLGSPHPTPFPDAPPRTELDQSGVERVVSSHRAQVKRQCFERGGDGKPSETNVRISASVAPDGKVVAVSSSGDDPVVAKCIEAQVKMWVFPPPQSTTTVSIPFKFVRQ